MYVCVWCGECVVCVVMCVVSVCGGECVVSECECVVSCV